MATKDRLGASNTVVLLGLAVGITATIVAWGILVLAAIDFGRDARAGATQSWYLLAGATAGAIACMFLAIIFATRLQARLKGGRPAGGAPTSQDVVAPPDAEPSADDAPAAAPAYRSKHSRAAEGSAPEESPDSPAAAYRGKRAAR